MSDAYQTWRTRGRTLQMGDLKDLLVLDSLASFGVVDQRDQGRIVGHVSIAGSDLISGVGNVSAFFDQRHPCRELFAGLALHQVAAHAFDSLGMRKLMIELADDETLPMARVTTRWKGHIRLEGQLKEHVMVSGRLRDLFIYCLTKDAWEDLTEAQSVALSHDGESFATVMQILGAVFDGQLKDPIFGGTTLVDDLGVDSLGLIEVLDGIENAGGDVSRLEAFPEHALCIQDLVEVLDRRV